MSWLVAAGGSAGQAEPAFSPPSAEIAGRDWPGADGDRSACACAAAPSRRSAVGRPGAHVAAPAIQAAIPEPASTAAPASCPAGRALASFGRLLLLVPAGTPGGEGTLDRSFVHGDAELVRDGCGQLRRGRRGIGGGVLLQEVHHRAGELVSPL